MITHPLHPYFGRTFLFDGWVAKRNRSLHYAVDEGNGRVRLGFAAISWTDLRLVDPFEQVSVGRSLFRVDDLLALSEAISAVCAGGREVVQK